MTKLTSIAKLLGPTGLQDVAGILKGGSGSGNFGHSGRPGERGGSSESSQPPLIQGNVNRQDVERANDKAYIKKLERNHGLKVEHTPNVDPVDLLAVHETLTSLPGGLKNWMKESAISVKVAAKIDDTPRQFTVNGQTFTEGGYANYRDGEIMVRTRETSNYQGTSRILSHEAGHFGVMSLVSQAADDQAAINAYDREIQSLKERRISADPKEMEIYSKQISEKVQLKASLDRDGVYRTVRAFDEASRSEGGVTPYSDSYVRDRSKGWSTDVFQIDESHAVDGFSGRAAITRAGNENFAEIMGKLYQNARSGRKLQLSALKQDKPKTYKAFKKLHVMLKNPRMKLTVAEAL